MPADTRPLAIALMGPTASGKSALAMDWACRLNAEIVSVDSALIYRGLDIGAAKPSIAEQAQVPHHLMDLCDPWQTYSAADFAKDACNAMFAIASRGRIPILAGGTGLYFHALLNGLAPMPGADPDIRQKISAEALQIGWPVLHQQLAEIDADAAAKIDCNDPQRIQRALEVYRLSGKPISIWQRESQPRRIPFRVLKLVLSPADRSVLHQRIERRLDSMLESGFLDEVRALRRQPEMRKMIAPLDLPAVRAVGYRQAWEHLDGLTSAAEFRAQAIYATRQLAKRQLTWLRGQADVRWFDPENADSELAAALQGFLPQSD